MLTLAHRVMLGAASRPKNDANIVTLAGPSSQSDTGSELALDADGNRIVCSYGGSTAASVISKLSPTGALLWQRKLTLASEVRARALCVDASTGDIYAVGYGRPSGSIDAGYAVKYSTSGTIQWQRKLSTTYALTAIDCALTSAGDLICLYRANDTLNKALLVKYSAGGVIQWQRVVSHTATMLSNGGLVLDSSGNIYFGAATAPSGSGQWHTAIVCNSSGSVSAAYPLRAQADTSNSAQAIARDASGNIYLAGQMVVAGGGKATIAKLNSSGVVQWLRYLTASDASTAGFTALAIAADGNLHAIRPNTYMKVSSSDGAIIWQRSLKTSATMSTGGSLVTADAFIHFAASLNVSGNNDAAAVAAPNDGDGLGTYGTNIVLSESTHTFTATSPLTTTITLTDAAGSFTEAAGDMTDAAGDLTVSTQVRTA